MGSISFGHKLVLKIASGLGVVLLLFVIQIFISTAASAMPDQIPNIDHPGVTSTGWVGQQVMLQSSPTVPIFNGSPFMVPPKVTERGVPAPHLQLPSGGNNTNKNVTTNFMASAAEPPPQFLYKIPDKPAFV